jgi:hypothetical protein
MDNQATNQEATGNTASPLQLSLQDLQNLVAIIDTAVRRGAFQAAEASTVGTAYDRLNAFVTAAVAAQSSAPAASDAPSA